MSGLIHAVDAHDPGLPPHYDVTRIRVTRRDNSWVRIEVAQFGEVTEVSLTPEQWLALVQDAVADEAKRHRVAEAAKAEAAKVPA